jgi:hypothetical protein
VIARVERGELGVRVRGVIHSCLLLWKIRVRPLEDPMLLAEVLRGIDAVVLRHGSARRWQQHSRDSIELNQKGTGRELAPNSCHL